MTSHLSRVPYSYPRDAPCRTHPKTQVKAVNQNTADQVIWKNKVWDYMCMYVYIYIYLKISVYTCINIYIYLQYIHISSASI